MKIFAFYLPQFHEVKENNEWWGNGFTEWTHVKAAKSLCKGHVQPIHPLNENYYNILEDETIQWQDSLMREYHIDGLIYYHYYFDGKLLLEKPAEKLLQQDSNRLFFFCWANHSWYKAVDGKKKLLIQQSYGTQDSWEKHFQYLLPFFKDNRYEKKNNKPLFMLFDVSFNEKEEMIQYWNKRCIEEGFDGIHIIETCVSNKEANDLLSNVWIQDKSVYLREPSNAKFLMRKKKPFLYIGKRLATFFRNQFLFARGLETYSGNSFFDLITQEYIFNQNIFHGLCFSWDNSPRHGRRGYRILEPDKRHVFDYLAKCKNDEYIFINAWNEWAEGMILEPTLERQYTYLEWIKDWKENDRLESN